MTENLRALSRELAQLVADGAPSVLRVEARRRLPATGIAWSEDLVVTANHAVESDEDIRVGAEDGARLEAELLGRDPRKDLALLRVDSKLRPANLAESADLRTGELVLALGRPRLRVNAALGMVSARLDADAARRRRARKRVEFEGSGFGFGTRGRRKQWRKRIVKELGGAWGIPPAGDVFLVDVTMYPGFSGGPLLGVDGAVYGMNTSGFGGGFGVAIPLAALSTSVDALLEHGQIPSGYLGIGVQTALLPEALAEALGQGAGLLIVSVEPGSPAAAANMMVGDILTALDGATLDDADELQMILAARGIGSTVATTFARGGEVHEGSVTVGAR